MASAAHLAGRIPCRCALCGRARVYDVAGPADEVRNSVNALGGVKGLDLASDRGWNRLAIESTNGRDVREEVFNLTREKGWTLREMRREVASLEDFFVKITAEQAGRG